MVSEKNDGASPKRRRIAMGAAKALAGLAVGLAVAEGAFCVRSGGAFPHLNVYMPDAELGVRLQPGATERVKFGPNPMTHVRVNAQGFRGADWPPPGEGEVLVVGDSQVFGLGVEEGETMSAALEKVLGKRVLNAGVPTYGPPEYARIAAEVMAKRPVSAVVFVINFSNDLFEMKRPNKDRHVVWDGWAVHSEFAPEHVTKFPGRELLYRKSHAFYALRQFLYERGPKYDDRAFTSKRTWRDVTLAAIAAEDDHEKARVETEELAQKHKRAVARARQASKKADAEVDQLIGKNIDPGVLDSQSKSGINYRAARASPGDIVGYVNDGEYDSPVAATAEMIRYGAIYRDKLEQLLKEKAQRTPTLAGDVERSFADRDQKTKTFTDLAKAPAPVSEAWSPVMPSLRAMKATCDEHKARLFVVALPLDVMISADEWKKYNAEPSDMKPAERLVKDLMDSAMAAGATGVDPTEALRAAEPGAFLAGDIHLTPKGHLALAEHIAKVMKEPPPLPVPKRVVPLGRTRPPAPKEWDGVREVTVRGSSAAECETLMIREWLRVVCKRNKPTSAKPVGIEVLEGGLGEAFVTGSDDVMVLLVPLVEGSHFTADFSWADRTQKLVIHWAKGAAQPDMVFAKPHKEGPSSPPPPLSLEPYCSCLKAKDPSFTCPGAVLSPSADCAKAYPNNCEKLLACADGDPDALPACPKGHVNAGATGGCHALCSGEVPCAKGVCTDLEGGKVCL